MRTTRLHLGSAVTLAATLALLLLLLSSSAIAQTPAEICKAREQACAEDCWRIRDDAATVARNIERLAAGWIDVVYGGEFDVRNHLGSDAARYLIHPWSPASSAYQWAIAKRLGERGVLVSKTVEAMVKDGTVERILSRYR